MRIELLFRRLGFWFRVLGTACLVVLGHSAVGSERAPLPAVMGSAAIDQLPEVEFQQAVQDAMAEAFRRGRYAEIEALGQRYRNSGARTSSGLWKSGMLYSGVSRFARELMDDEANFQILLRFHDQWIAAFP